MATTITARPPQGIHVHHKPIRCVPGITRGSRTVACPPPDAPPPRAPCRLQNLVGGRVGVRGHGSALGCGRGAVPTDVPVAGRPVVRCHVCDACLWSGERGMYTTNEPLTINSHIASAPVLLQDIFLESNLRDGLHVVDRTGYSTSDVMYIGICRSVGIHLVL